MRARRIGSAPSTPRLGVQTLTVTDAANPFSASASITVPASRFAAPVPVLSRTGTCAALALLAMAGIRATAFRRA